MTAAPLLAAESIGKAFGRRRVLTAGGLWAWPGRITALVGRNGSGKTTLLRIAAGWMRADYGVVIYDGDRLSRPRLALLARVGMFLLPERGLMTPAMTVRQHFDVLARQFGDHGIAGALDVARVTDLLDRRPRTLSGGERRRTELAFVLARRPRCLLADEPFLGLMPRDAELMGQTLRHLAEEGVAVVATGHEVRELFSVADDVLWQTSGTTHALGSPRDASQRDQFVREYLGPR